MEWDGMGHDDIELRPLGHSDAPRIYAMLRSYRQYDTSSAAEQSYDDWLCGSFPQAQYYEHVDDGYLTILSLGGIDWINRTASFGIFSERPGAGYGFRSGLALFEIAFDKIGLNRLVCTVRSDNARCLAAIAKYGPLRHEATLRQALFRDGRFVDMELFAILVGDWRKV